MTHDELVARSEAYIKDLLRRRLPEGTPVYLYGSRARGDAGFSSDFDLLVGGNPQPALLIALKEEIEESFVPFDVDLVAEASLSGRFREAVMQERRRWA